MGSEYKRAPQIDPLAITESLGFQTFRRESRKPWTKKEDTDLINIINELYPNQLKDLQPDAVKWDVIAQRVFPNGSRKPKDCRKRWCNSLSPSLKKGKWTKEEDEQLIQAYKQFGASWQKVSLQIQGRTDDQCAKRYIEVLDPNTKDRLKPWDHDEDLQLIRQVKIHGTKWRTIALEINGRPSLTCRNRWRKLVTDVVRGKADPVIREEVNSITSGGFSDSDGKLTGENTNTELSENDNSHFNSDKNNFSNGANRKFDENVHADSDQPGFRNFNNQQSREDVYASSRQKRQTASRPVTSLVEWKYTLSGDEKRNTELPHKLLFNEEGGNIKNQELVHYLISYAKAFNLEITVHQHIHHHYSPPTLNSITPDISGYSYQNQNAIHSLNSDHDLSQSQDSFGQYSGSINLFGESGKTNVSPYYIEPETQLNRYQHFNYLPPLIEVPKLTSSSPPPMSSIKQLARDPQLYGSNGRQINQMQQDQNDLNLSSGMDKEGSAANRESDLIKLLNGGNRDRNNKLMRDHEFHSSSQNGQNSNSLAPLTQAVEMAASAEASKNVHPMESASDNRSDHSYSSKKQKIDQNEEEELEEGMDFWETMRNLSDFTNQQMNSSVANSSLLNNAQPLKQKPVSQHHPLHYFSGSTTPQPTSNMSFTSNSMKKDVPNDPEIDPDDYGLFYNVYSKEPSNVPSGNSNNSNDSVYDSLVSSFGMIPFNPS